MELHKTQFLRMHKPDVGYKSIYPHELAAHMVDGWNRAPKEGEPADVELELLGFIVKAPVRERAPAAETGEEMGPPPKQGKRGR